MTPGRRAQQFGPEERFELPDTGSQPYRIHTALADVAPSDHDSLQAVLRSIRRSWWIILICALAAGGAGVAIARSKPQQYQASTYLLINSNTYQSVIAGGSNPTDPQAQEATIAGLLTPKLLASSAQSAGLPANATYSVSVAPTGSNSSVISIVVTARNQHYAAALSKAVSRALVSFLQRNNAAQLREATRVLNAQVHQARSATDRHTLTGELNNLNDLKALVNDQVQVIETPKFGAAIPLKTARTGAIGLVIGLLFGLAVSLMRRRELPELVGSLEPSSRHAPTGPGEGNEPNAGGEERRRAV